MVSDYRPGKVEFIGGTLDPSNFKIPDLPCIVFAGRSNVGKSSLLNMLLGRKIAHTGKKPGKTRAINFFIVDDRIIFVDLPGYGYAKVSHELQEKWRKAVDIFLRHPCVRGGIILIDIRHPPMKNDLILFNYFLSIPLNFRVVLTKADKLGRNQQVRMRNLISKELKIPPSELIVTSARTGEGAEDLWKVIFEMTGVDLS